MDNQKIEKIKGEVDEALNNVIELNGRIDSFLNQNETVEKDIEADFPEDLEQKELKNVLKELDENLNDALLDFSTKEKE